MSKATFGVIVFTAAPEADAAPGGAYVKVDGREALLRSVELFVNRENVAAIVVGLSPNDADEAKRKFGSHLMILGFKAATGGPGLRDQLKACAEKLPAEVTHVIVHDAARPAVSPPDLEKLLVAAEKHPAVALVSPVRGTTVTLDEAGQLSDARPGRSLRHLLYPQAYTRAIFDEWLAKGYDAILSRVEPRESSPLNVRVNGAADAGMLKAMLALLPKPAAKASSNPFEEAQW